MMIYNNRFPIASAILAVLLASCGQPELYETSDAPTQATPGAEIRSLEEEVAEYPRSFEGQAQQTLTVLQRAQQAHYLERRQFASSPDGLSIGLDLDSDAYRFQIEPNNTDSWVLLYAIPKFDSLRSYTAVVTPNTAGDRLLTLTCESETPSTTAPTVTGSGDQITCAAGSTAL